MKGEQHKKKREERMETKESFSFLGRKSENVTQLRLKIAKLSLR